MVDVIAPKSRWLWVLMLLCRSQAKSVDEVNLEILTTLPTGVAGVGESIEIHD